MDAGAASRQETGLAFLPASASFKLVNSWPWKFLTSHGLASWSLAAPPVPPPSLNMHPASMLILDNESVLEIGKFTE